MHFVNHLVMGASERSIRTADAIPFVHVGIELDFMRSGFASPAVILVEEVARHIAFVRVDVKVHNLPIVREIVQRHEGDIPPDIEQREH